MSLRHQMRALGRRELPAELTVRGRLFRLENVFKHGFLAAVGVYAAGEDRIVLKCHREAPFLLLPTAWAGSLMARYEAAALARVQGIPGVARLVGPHGRTGILREFVPGHLLTRGAKVADAFFPQLLELLDAIHRRGLAYVDLEKPGNVVVGGDGRPYLIDFQVAFHVPDRFLGGTTLARAVRSWLQKSDLYHARKHWRRVRPDQLTDEQVAHSRLKPWPVRLGNRLLTPVKKLRRRLMGR